MEDDAMILYYCFLFSNPNVVMIKYNNSPGLYKHHNQKGDTRSYISKRC